jgi:hypothetical protein
MLGSITSLGERGRGRHWPLTYSWFLLGTLAGGLTLAGALLVLRAAGDALPRELQLAVGFGAGTVLLAASALGRTPPSFERQVDHRWLDEYRGWVVGAGFGFQLGAAAFTRISSFAVYLLLVFAFLGASPSAVLAAGLVYGGIRGLSAAPGGLIRSPRDLQRMTAVIVRLDGRTARLGRVVDAAASASLVGAILVALL